MKKATLFVSLLFIFSITSFAQTHTGTLSGKITDGGDQKIIDAATVSLNKEGNFEFINLVPLKYYLLATSIGHLATYSSTINVAEGEKVFIGSLKLNNNIKTLKGITVTAKKPFIERKIDRTIINVDASITNTGTSALEVLEKSPGVSVDKDGNVSLKGKAGVMIMLDGKPSYLSGQDLTNLLTRLRS
jgi:iron complex outermembrane receptor protein